MADGAGEVGNNLGQIGDILAAVSALGLAAYGLVDSSKALGGGASNHGFSFIANALKPYLDAITQMKSGAGGDASETLILPTLKANWLNGVAKETQKAAAKSLINLNLNKDTAAKYSAAAGVDSAALTAAATDLNAGKELSEEHINVMGRFNVVLSATLDMAYERADQSYRNATKGWAAVVSVALSCIAGGIIHARDNTADTSAALASYFSGSDFVLALVIGVVAIPLAPIAKDLSSSLSSAVAALSRIRK